MKLLTLFFACLINYALPHSWIACSDYTEKNGRHWKPSKCRGYPRDAARYARKRSFGRDRMFNHSPTDIESACKTKYRAGSYTKGYPKAIYFPGQQVILVHPMKNHGADVCTNRYIPDHGSFIYRGRKNTDRDRPFPSYKPRVVADLGVSVYGHDSYGTYRKYPKPGYQNAPAFCEDTDKAMGTYSFNVPKNLDAGEYTFVWRWSFNGPTENYMTCFDVIIARNKLHRDRLLTRRGMSLEVTCGGETSNLSPGSKIGCDEPSEKSTPPPTEPTTTRRRRITTTKPPTTTRRPRTRTTRKPRPKPTTRLTTKFTTTRPTYTRPRTFRPRTAPATTATTTFKPINSKRAALGATQISGEIMLERSRKGVTRRYVSVEFDCPGRVNFWNARITQKSEDSYTILQEASEHLGSQKIYFTASFDKPCDLVAYPPIARLEQEE